MMRLFHDFCDWRPPLYYTFTSAVLFFYLKVSWLFTCFQLVLAFTSLILGYKIIRLFFSEKTAFWATLIWFIEPL